MYSMFFYIAIPSTIIFGIIIMASLIGFGDVDIDMETDMDVDVDDTSTFPIFSVKNLLGFLSMFSWVGMVCVKFGLGTFPTIIISLISGILFVAILSALFILISRLSNENVPSMKDAVGRKGTVYLRIPTDGIGQISVIINGSLQTVSAMSKGNKSFKNGDIVEVVDSNDSELIVDSI